MKRFTELFCELDRTTRTNEKVAALERYFAQAPPADAAWVLQFLCGRRLRRAVASKRLRRWIASETKLPEWLIEECYDAVGDLAETLALLQPNDGTGSDLTLSQLVEQRLLPLRSLSDNGKRSLLIQTWRELAPNERIVWNKLITGDFRVGAAQTLVVRALASMAGIEPAVMAHRVMGKWQPTADDFQRLMSPDAESSAIATPYPFFLASPLEMRLRRGDSLEDLGGLAAWQMEWKWDGIRAQLIRRRGHTLIWTRGDEMVTESFPEVVEAGEQLPDGTVLDGEILAWRGSSPLPFAVLQRRLGRKIVDFEARELFPVAFMAYDLLELKSGDLRGRPLAERRAELERMVFALPKNKPPPAPNSTPWLPGFISEEMAAERPIIRLSPLIPAQSWTEVADLHREARTHGAWS
jgi:DNA ligase-1